MLAGRDVLLDTSALVGLLDPHDQWHGPASAAYSGTLERCLTTEAVLVEAAHFAERGGLGPTAPLTFLLALDIPIVAVHRPLHEDCAELMRRYAGMDYADATLVGLAGRLDLKRVFTFDRRGFRQYRASPNAPAFEIIPDR